ncbi:MAG: META domain-containing protein [Actinobacteria bacterium]|nr:META domain-containing protein [Actinomycetota bacterium]
METRHFRLPRWAVAVAAVGLVAVISAVGWSMRAYGTVPAEPAGGSAALAGTRWTLTSIGGGPVFATADGDVPFVQFDSATSASGGDPCNLMQSGYAIAGDRIGFTGWRSTEMACGSRDVVVQQGRYGLALGAAASFRVTGNTLDLLDASGTVVLSFTRAAFVEPVEDVPPTGDPDEPVSNPGR